MADVTRKARRLARAAEEEAIALESARPTFGSDPPAPKGGRWPTRKARAAAEGLASAALDVVEERARGKAVTQLVGLLREADRPVTKELGGAVDPDSCLRFFTGGRRAATIKARLSAWKSFRAWLVRTHWHGGPGSPIEVVNYLAMRVKESCGRTVPQSLLSAVAFLEDLGRVSVPDRLSPQPLVVGALGELTATRGPGAGSPLGRPRGCHWGSPRPLS